MSLDAEKNKALDAALKQIEKDFGKGSIMKLGAASAKMNIETIPTGALSLDIALGVGGIPRGRIIEIYGPESSGKTTVALHMIAEALKRGGYAAFIDAEHALDPEYARHLGVDIDNLLISQPDTGEQALEICDALVRSGALDIIDIASVAAQVPKAEIEGDMGDSHVGLQARLMSQALRKLTGVIAKSRTATVFITQIREKDGVMFGNPEVTTGGRALAILEKAGLLKQKEGVGVLATANDIVDNPKNLKITEAEAAMLPRTLDDVDLAVINSNFAMEAKMHPTKDALFIDAKDSPYANIVAVRKGDETRPEIQKLMKALNSPEVKKFIEEKYQGAIIPAF